MLLVPTNLPDHVSGGRTKSSTMTAVAMSAGAAARYGSALRQVSPGRDSARARPNALAASVIVTTNLKRKRGVSAAAAISGLGPSIAKKTAAARVIARPAAPHHTDESDAAGGRVSAAKALMSSFVSILVPPEPLGDRRQAAMECYPHRRLGHAEALGRLADRQSIDRNRCDNGALAGRKRLQGATDLPVADDFRFGLGEGFHDLADLDLRPAPATAKGVDELVACDRVQPRSEGRIVPPCMALHVDRQQGLLHDILRVDAALYDLASGKAAHEAGRPAQEFRIGSLISCKRGAQKPGKFGFVVAVQACLLPIRLRAAFGYVAGRSSLKPSPLPITKL